MLLIINTVEVFVLLVVLYYANSICQRFGTIICVSILSVDSPVKSIHSLLLLVNIYLLTKWHCVVDAPPNLTLMCALKAQLVHHIVLSTGFNPGFHIYVGGK